MALRTRSAKGASLGGVLLKPLLKHSDDRGSLTELFRGDELPAEVQPAMGYLSRTEPGVVRGPHEHREQTDCFCFLSGRFKLYLWDNRRASPTFGALETHIVGARRPMLVVIPPGVVHAYKNLSPKPGLVLNFPNRLYKGSGRGEPVDEIRHEDDPLSPFRVP